MSRARIAGQSCYRVTGMVTRLHDLGFGTVAKVSRSVHPIVDGLDEASAVERARMTYEMVQGERFTPVGVEWLHSVVKHDDGTGWQHFEQNLKESGR